MTIRQRAISEEEKLERREAILAAALKLLTKNEYQDIHIADIARKAGIAKGTIFLYFRTKEELFLQLQVREYQSWFNNINRQIQTFVQQKQAGRIDGLVEAVVSSVEDHPMLIQLTPILHVVLEQNIDYQTALEFKRFLLNEMQTTGRLIEQYLPFLQKQDGARFLMDLHILLVGLIQASHPSSLVEQVIHQKGMEALKVNFAEKLEETLTLLLRGRQAMNAG